MTIDGAILARAAEHAGLTALIAARIYAVEMEQNPTYPVVVFTPIAETYEHASGADESTRHAVYQFACWAETYEGAQAVADQVHAAFSRYGGTLDGTYIEQIFADNRQPIRDPETRMWQVIVDVEVHYRA